MTLNSSRLPMAKALVALIKTFQNPSTGLPLYQYVKLGSVFDASPYQSFCEVTHFEGVGGPEGSGGPQIQWRINDDMTFQITSGFGPYQLDSTTCEINMLATQDILLPLLRKHFELPDASNPLNAIQSVYSVLVQAPDKSTVKPYPGGNVYKLWSIWVLVKQGYNIELVQP